MTCWKTTTTFKMFGITGNRNNFQKRRDTANKRCPFIYASKPVSRVLSFKTAIYLDVPLPVRSSRLLRTTGPVMCSPTALLRIEFTAMDVSTPSGELLPHLSTFACRKAGSLFLLPFSWGRPRRVLPVILALWSPDFPHARAFRPVRAAVQLACELYFIAIPAESQTFKLEIFYKNMYN